MRDLYRYHRKAWDEDASFHLARVKFGEDWKERLSSFFWLLTERVPLNGAAPTLNHKGLPR